MSLGDAGATLNSFGTSKFGRERRGGCDLAPVVGGSVVFNGWRTGPYVNGSYIYAIAYGNPSAALIFNGANTEKFNGTSWTAESNWPYSQVLSMGGCGVPTAALVCGGVSAGGSVIASTYFFNGSAWSTLNPMNTARAGPAAFGTAGAAVACGGAGNLYTVQPYFPLLDAPANPILNSSETFNGTSWTTNVNTMVSNLVYHAAFGISSAGATVGGSVTDLTGAVLSLYQLWNGSVWSTSLNSLNTARWTHAGFGTTAGAMVAGGLSNTAQPSSSNVLASAEVSSGAAWSVAASTLVTKRYLACGCGNAVTGMVIGGFDSSQSALNTTEIFTNGPLTVYTPVAKFYGTPLNGNAPLSVQFTDQSLNLPIAWIWHFGDGGTSTIPSPSHTYTVQGEVCTVWLTVINQAGYSTTTETNYITAKVIAPVASFTATPQTGSYPLAVQFTDTSLNTPTSWLWSFGDGGTSTSQSPSYSYANPGVYSVSLKSTNAAGNNTLLQTNFITVTLVTPVAAFSGTPLASSSPPLTVQFTDASTNSPSAWSWTFGDGGTSTAQSPQYTYTTSGTFTVALTASNSGGPNTVTKIAYVTTQLAAPVANFTGTPLTGTVPLGVQFTDSSTNSPTSWAWTFGDGGTSTAQNPLYTYEIAGTYTVTLTATNAAGGNLFTQTNYVTASPSGVQSWRSVASLNVVRKGGGVAGTVAAALAYGGYNAIASCELYNGISWTSLVASMDAGRAYFGFCGTATAALAVGGQGNGLYGLGNVGVYNGVTWAGTGSLVTGRQNLPACGSTSAALAMGGQNSSFTVIASVEKFNGTTWATMGNSMNAVAEYHAGVGTTGSAMVAGGFEAHSAVETFNGTSWTTSGNTLNTGRYEAGFNGVETAALIYGGTTGSDIGSTELWNGTAWSLPGQNLATSMSQMAGCGTTADAMCVGGDGVTGQYCQIYS